MSLQLRDRRKIAFREKKHLNPTIRVTNTGQTLPRFLYSARSQHFVKAGNQSEKLTPQT